MHSFKTYALAALLLAASASSAPAQRAPSRTSSSLPTPASILGWEPGTDKKLPSWKQVTDYFAALDAASPRIQVHTLGRTTLGRPFIAAFIGDPATLANLDKVRDAARRLADPRLTTPAERAALERD